MSYGWRDGNVPSFSPWASAAGSGPVHVTEDDYAYVTSQEVEDEDGMPARTYNPRTGRTLEVVDMPDMPSMSDSPPRVGGGGPLGAAMAPSRSPEAKPEPDILVVKHNRVVYPLHFPAYSIGDGKLLVQDLRSRVGLTFDLSDRRTRRLKMLYKGKQLKDAGLPVRDYGVKNNSEIMVVMPPKGDEAAESGDREREAAFDDLENDGPVIVSPDGSLVSGEGSDRKSGGGRGKKNRKNRNRGGRKDGGEDAASVGSRSPPSVDMPSPPADDDDRSNVSYGRETPAPAARHMAAPAPSLRRAKSPAPPPPRSTPSPPTGPQSEAVKKLAAINANFRTALLPECERFGRDPPSDAKKKTDEYKRLTEVIMAQVLLKLDAVETAGEEEARLKRKALVHEVQEVLKGLDKVVGK